MAGLTSSQDWDSFSLNLCFMCQLSEVHGVWTSVSLNPKRERISCLNVHSTEPFRGFRSAGVVDINSLQSDRWVHMCWKKPFLFTATRVKILSATIMLPIGLAYFK